MEGVGVLLRQPLTCKGSMVTISLTAERTCFPAARLSDDEDENPFVAQEGGGMKVAASPGSPCRAAWGMACLLGRGLGRLSQQGGAGR